MFFRRKPKEIESQTDQNLGGSQPLSHEVVAIEGEPITGSEDNAALASQARHDAIQNLKIDLHRILVETLDLTAAEQAPEQQLKNEISEIVSESLSNAVAFIDLSADERQLIITDLYAELRGLGPIDSLMRDETISDILINGPQKIYVERSGKLVRTQIKFKDEQHLRRILDKMVSTVGRRIDIASPYVDARLQDGSRLNAVISPISVDGTVISIRKLRKEKLGIQDLLRFNTLSAEMAEYLKEAVRSKLNILISGGTGSGKTTTLNILSSFIDPSERIITLEDTAELQLQQEHVVRLESRTANAEGRGAISLRDCLRNALRMRPNRILIGEVRGDEVIEMLQAMNSGHRGSMTTIHANSPRDALGRIENLVSMAGYNIPIRIVRHQIANSIHIVIQVDRQADGSRIIQSIYEVTGIEGEIVTTQEMFGSTNPSSTLDKNRQIRFYSTELRSHHLRSPLI